MKHFIIVGGSKGIGREFIKKLLKNKNNIILLISRYNIDINSENIIHFATDLLNKRSLNKTIELIKKLNYKYDSIVFCQKYRPAKKENYNFQDELMLSVQSTQVIIETFSNDFNINGQKSIVIIGSIASKFVALEQPANYHISKSALVGLMNFYALSLAKKNIRINMVSPSSVIKDENKKFYNNNKKLSELYKSISPQGEILKSKDVSNLIYYLLSKGAKFITAQNIIIDGGISLQWQETMGRELLKFNHIQVTR